MTRALRIFSEDVFSANSVSEEGIAGGSLGRVFNVRDFGAVGDGFADDTNAIRAAIQEATLSTSGKTVFFPATEEYGSFKCTDLITVGGDVTLLGQKGNGAFGHESAITMTDVGKDLFQMNGNVWAVRNLLFRHHVGRADRVIAAGATSFTFNRLEGVSYTSIQPVALEVNFTAITIHGYYSNAGQIYRALQSGAAGGTLPNHVAGDVAHNGVTYRWVASQISGHSVGAFGFGQIWYFDGNTTDQITGVVPAPGETLYADPAAMVAALGGVDAINGGRGYFSSLFSNHATIVSDKAFIYAAQGQDSKIQGCWFNACYGAAVRRGSAFQGGTWMDNTVDVARYGFIGNFTNARIWNNQFYGCTAYAVWLQEYVNADISLNWFDTNHIDIFADSNDTYDGSNIIPHALRTDLSIAINRSKASNHFLKLRGAAHSQVFGNKIFRAHRDPIWIIQSAFCDISGNKLIGAGEVPETAASTYGYIRFDLDTTPGGLSSNKIHGNHFTHINAGQKTDSVFKFAAGTEAFAATNNFQGNVYNVPGGTARHSSNVTGTTAQSPVRTITSTVVWDPGNLAAGASATTSVTVTGAAAGDLANAALSSNVTPGMTIKADVTSANTVTVTLTNETAGPVDLGSGTLRAMVMKY